MHDVLVVGSGPSGSYVSYSLARLGFDVVNMEEHREVGRPVECTGLVSERVFKYVKTKAEVNSVNGAHIFFLISAPEDMAIAEASLSNWSLSITIVFSPLCMCMLLPFGKKYGLR